MIEASAEFLGKARAAAELCGVTRLADITRLDRLGLPVWQAVRPAGKALSVHQGKGASHLNAQIGALCEAIECHCAENAAADGPRCAFGDLLPSERAADISDYWIEREKHLDEDAQVQWCCATDLASGKPHYLPHAVVSLNYTQGLPSRFERVSGGLGAGADQDQALQTSLFELIERDACGDWQRLGRAAQDATRLLADTIDLGWFQSWRDRLQRLGVETQVYHVPSLIDVPMFTCIIGGMEEFGTTYRRFYGMAAHGEPEVALFKAFAEAVQTRLTRIAGVRDDIPLSYYEPRPRTAAVGEDAPNGVLRWSDINPLPGGVEMVVERLAARGYREVLAKRLDRGLEGIAVTRAFVPGLGSLTRTRRVVG